MVVLMIGSQHGLLPLCPPDGTHLLPLCVQLRPNLLLLIPLCYQAQSVPDGELLRPVEAVDCNSEVTATLHEEVVLVVALVELHSPATAGVPAHSLDVALVPLPVNGSCETLCLNGAGGQHAPNRTGSQERERQGLVAVRFRLIMGLLQLDDATSRSPPLPDAFGAEASSTGRHWEQTGASCSTTCATGRTSTRQHSPVRPRNSQGHWHFKRHQHARALTCY
mmetsp:Transcript_23226/g.41554  ORF Transcript_23226/g.41554 Transcript_23226/m.41554 type:complete len:222 (-) Transcript_23226:116-781(-)